MQYGRTATTDTVLMVAILAMLSLVLVGGNRTAWLTAACRSSAIAVRLSVEM